MHRGCAWGETPPATWQEGGGCLEMRLKGIGKSLISHTLSSSFPLDEQSEPGNREGWQRRPLQGDPEKTRQLLPCDVCSLMFCPGMGALPGRLVHGLHPFLRCCE